MFRLFHPMESLQAVGNYAKSTAATYVTPVNLNRFYNLGTALFVSYYFINDPNAATLEYLTDIYLHFKQAGTDYNSSEFDKWTLELFNTLRGIKIVYDVGTGNATIPFAAELADIVNHFLNIGMTTALLFPKEKLRFSFNPREDNSKKFDELDSNKELATFIEEQKNSVRLRR